MSNGLLVQPDPAQQDIDAEALYRQLMQIVGRDTGLADWGSNISHTSYSSDAEYAHTIFNQGTGGHLNIPGVLSVPSDGSGISITTLSVATLNVSTLLNVTGNAVLGNAGTDALTVNAASTFNASVHLTGALAVDGNTTLGNASGDTTSMSGDASVGGNLDVAGELTADGNVTLGNAATDLVSIQGDLDVDHDVVIGSGSAGSLLVGTQTLWADPQNTRVGIGTNSPNASYVLDVNGNVQFQDDADILGTLSVSDKVDVSQLVVGAGTFSGTEELRVVGQTRLEGATTITTGGLNASGSSIFQDGLTIQNSASISGGLSVTSGGIGVEGSSVFDDAVTIGTDLSTGNTGLQFLNNCVIDFDYGSGSGYTTTDNNGDDTNWSGTIRAKYEGAEIRIPFDYV